MSRHSHEDELQRMGEISDQLRRAESEGHICNFLLLSDYEKDRVRAFVEEPWRRLLRNQCLCFLSTEVQSPAMHRHLLMEVFATDEYLWSVPTVLRAAYAYRWLQKTIETGESDQQRLVNVYQRHILHRDSFEFFSANLTPQDYFMISKHFGVLDMARRQMLPDGLLRFARPISYMKRYPGFLREEIQDEVVIDNEATEELLSLYYEQAFWAIFNRPTGDHLTYPISPERDFFDSFSFERRELLCKTSKAIREPPDW